jgi:tRNA threonylcarbamoyl adenosine modification protein YeaZ
MKILALEFSSAQRSVAILHQALDGRMLSASEAVETGGRETKAFGMIQRVLAEAGVEREQIECLAVGLGPGSYTGIRSAIAIAQGWQLASPVKLLGIGSDEVLAAQAQKDGLEGRINILIDAQRKEFYLTSFEISQKRCERREPLHLASAEEVRIRHQTGQIIVGPEVLYFEGARLMFPSASTLATLASNRSDFVAGQEMRPIYLRQTNFIKAPPARILPQE